MAGERGVPSKWRSQSKQHVKEVHFMNSFGQIALRTVHQWNFQWTLATTHTYKSIDMTFNSFKIKTIRACFSLHVGDQQTNDDAIFAMRKLHCYRDNHQHMYNRWVSDKKNCFIKSFWLPNWLSVGTEWSSSSLGSIGVFAEPKWVLVIPVTGVGGGSMCCMTRWNFLYVNGGRPLFAAMML